MGPRPKMKINTVARTKLGVYSCPSLRIAENQEQGKDRRRIFCPRLLKTNSFSFFFFFVFLFFWFFSFLSPHEDTYLIGLTIHKLPKAGLILFHLGLPLITSSFHFSSRLTSNDRFFFISYLGLSLTASSLHFHLWAYL